MIEGKGLGGKKINRVNVSLTNKFNNKLLRLSTACGMRPTTLAGLLIEKSLDDQQLVTDLQLEFGIHNAYKVVPVRNYDTGEIVYTLNERC
ncbi:hypothetical protein [Cytobacillus praedii]|uniref:Uncharacterized protein n=1 Tax=Cytobacillus praedii TaxID=1742358 RepID=A0A4R1B079_9BACI|nr:hypothetical protein [Cytobacillus praedii]TCJ04480.1 hypothetical protein E0Y62_10310 [Cytobacillus praedii]